MFRVHPIISQAYQKAHKITINEKSKLIFMSDIHKGDNSYADDFRNNMKIYHHALEHYLKQEFTYIELGDGIELWENKSFKPIYKTYKNTFELLKQFNRKKRLYLIWGNHDMEFRDPIFVEQILLNFFTPQNIAVKEELFDLKYYESILLNIEGTNKNIFALHGHQADYMNYKHWKFNRFFVRHFWKYMQRHFGIKDPTSPAKNYRELIKVERKLCDWIVKNNQQMIICGHTHRPRFPAAGDIPLFNDGSCVHPKSIIGIEIKNLEIALIKWHLELKSDHPKIIKTILEGPVPLKMYL